MKKTIMIDKEFLERILVENAKMKIELNELKKDKAVGSLPMERQISIEEYTKSLKKEKK